MYIYIIWYNIICYHCKAIEAPASRKRHVEAKVFLWRWFLSLNDFQLYSQCLSMKHICFCFCMQESLEDDDIQLVFEKIVMKKSCKGVKRERLHIKPEPGLLQFPPFIRRPWQILQSVFSNDFVLEDGSLPAPLQLSPISQGHGTMWYYVILYHTICKFSSGYVPLSFSVLMIIILHYYIIFYTL